MKPAGSLRVVVLAASFAVFTVSGLGQGQPRIYSVVNAGDYSPGLVEMSLGVVFGAFTPGTAVTAAPPDAPANTVVMICGSKPQSDFRIASAPNCTPLNLLSVGPDQISFVVPAIPGAAESAGGGPVWIVVQTNGQLDEDSAAGNSYQTYVSVSHPALLQAGFDCYFGATDPLLANVPCGLTATQVSAYQTLRGMVTDSAGRTVASLNPVRPGRNYTIWLTGLSARGTPPAEAHVFLGLEDQLLMASSMEEINPDRSRGFQQVVFNVPAALNSVVPCAGRRMEISLWVSQNVAGTRYLSKPVNLPLQLTAGGVPCGGD